MSAMIEMEEEKKSGRRRSPQILAAFTANIGSFALGHAIGWSSPVLPQIADCGSECDIDDLGKEVGSWIGSLVALGGLFGALIAGSLMSRIGLRSSMILMVLPFTAGWVLLCLAKPLSLTSPIVFYVGRILTGVGGGAFTLLTPAYTSEVCALEIRGAMGSLMEFMLTSGVLFTNVLGSLIDWSSFTAICTIFPVLMALGMFFMPESPYYLVLKGRELEAQKALQWLHGGANLDVDKEMEEIKTTLTHNREVGEVSFTTLLTTSFYVRPLVIILVIMFFQQFCGVNGVLFYLQELFIKAGTGIDPGLSSSLVSLAQVLTTGLAVVLVDKFGRRPLLMLSGLFMAISLVVLATFFYLDANKRCEDDHSDLEDGQCTEDGYEPQLVERLAPLPLISLIIYIMSFASGYGPLAWMMNGEFFCLEAKSKAATIGTIFNWIGAFLVPKLQVNVEDAITTAGLYFMYAVICFISAIFVFFWVPESKGKSPEQLKKSFQN